MAHLTFDEENHKKHGYFTMLLSADSAEEAVSSIRDKLMAVRNGSHAFDDVDEIYLDDIIEIERFPEKPVLLRYESMDVKDQTTLSANPIDQQGLKVLHWWPRGKEQGYQKEKFDIEPFIRWH
jgi:hypothetical protein